MQNASQAARLSPAASTLPLSFPAYELMKNFAIALLFVALTALCWGVYGPVLSQGQKDMGAHAHWRPFICVGLAYFVIAIVVPAILLRLRPERGAWTFSGTTWSLIAGAAGALGALGIILAFTSGGKPIYVMPLVFGCAPVVNTLYTMLTHKDHARPSPLFIAGLIIVAAGAVTVLLFKPVAQAAPRPAVEDQTHAAAAGHERVVRPVVVTLCIAMTALCWGVYGPLLHKGQMLMQGSRLRPLVCVGVAYFVIAVVLPTVKLLIQPEDSSFFHNNSPAGTLWSLAGGAAGALGALGVILAFNFGGKPIYVMPLVFGCAPVINTLIGIQIQGAGMINPFFYAGLILVVVGAVTVLVFAPRSGPKPQPAHAPQGAAAGQPAGT